MGASNFGSAGMSLFAASRIKGISNKEPEKNDWWIPVLVAVIGFTLLFLMYR